MKRFFLRSSEAKKINEFLTKKFGLRDKIKRKSQVEVLQEGEIRIYKVEDLLFVKKENIFFPHLYTLRNFEIELPKVLVDKGAILHILKGADVMAPGITSSDEFQIDEIVEVVAEKGGIEIAIGQALVSSVELKEMKKGKAVKNLHYLNDKIWRIAKKYY